MYDIESVYLLGKTDYIYMLFTVSASKEHLLTKMSPEKKTVNRVSS